MFGKKLFIQIPILILFFYQFYDLIDNYFRYDYSFKLDFDTSSRTLPSITICLNEKHDLTHLFENYKNPYGNKTVVCYSNDDLSIKYYDFNEEKLYKRYRHKDICLTFLNHKNTFYEELLSKSARVSFLSFMYSQQTVIIHPPDTVSHFELNNVFVSKRAKFLILNLVKETKFTLPKPYWTDCHDYSQYRKSSQSPRSQSYCMLEYMRKEELKKCGKNIYWNQFSINNDNQVFDYKGNYSVECIVKMNFKLLSRLCKIDCVSITYKIKSVISESESWNPILEIPLPRKYNINLVYEPKMTMVTMFSNLGGLISMYFGLSMIDLGIIAYDIFIKFITRKFIKLTLAILKNSLKILIYFIMMFQLYIILITYFGSNTIIKINFNTNYKFSKIALSSEPILDIESNDKYFPEFKENYESMHDINDKHRLINFHLYNIFLQNLTTFVYITRLFDRKIECSIELGNNILLDCGEIKLSKIIFSSTMYLLYEIPSENMINITRLNNFNRLSIKFFQPNYNTYSNIIQTFYTIFHNSIFTSYLPGEFHSRTLYNDIVINNFIVEPTYYRKLTYFGRQCNPRVRPLFDDSLTDDCIMDCVRKRSIDDLNCIPFKFNFGFIRWKKDIIESNRDICNLTDNLKIRENDYILKCIDECKFDCELVLSKVTAFYPKVYIKRQNYILITIIPKSNLIVQYEEQYVMDGWELIYQLGGVVGMWVGWSAISISSIRLTKSELTKQYSQFKILTSQIILHINNYCWFINRVCNNSSENLSNIMYRIFHRFISSLSTLTSILQNWFSSD